MPVYIFEPDALDKLTQVEGPHWRAHHDELFERNKDDTNGTGRGYNFYDFKNAWDASRGSEHEEYWREIYDPRLYVIYGDGGYARYAVLVDGEIVLLGGSTYEVRREFARKVGFTVRETGDYGP